jgi:hypothetical protein
MRLACALSLAAGFGLPSQWAREPDATIVTVCELLEEAQEH